MADDASSMFAFPTVTSDQMSTPTDTAVIDTPVEDTPIDDVQVDETPADISEVTEETPADETDEKVPADKSSAQPKQPTVGELQKNLAKLHKELKATNPEAAKLLDQTKDIIGRGEAYAKLGTVDQIRAKIGVVDSFGGPEAIARYQTIANEVELTDTQLEAGDPVVLDKVFEDAPEGMVKLFRPYMDKMLERAKTMARAGDPTALNAFEEALQPHTFATLERIGFESVLTALASANDISAVKSLHAELKKWWDGEREKSRQGPVSKVDPREVELGKRETEFQKQQDNAFQGQIGQAIIAHTNKEFGIRLQPYLAGRNLSASQKADIANALYREMDKEIKADTSGTLQMNALMRGKNRDAQKAIAHGTSAITERADRVVKKVMEQDYGFTIGKPKAKVTKPTTTRDENGKFVTLPKDEPKKIIRVTRSPAGRLLTTKPPPTSSLSGARRSSRTGKL